MASAGLIPQDWKAGKVTAAGFELISKLGIKTIQGSSKFVYYLFKGCSKSALLRTFWEEFALSSFIIKGR